MASDPVAQREAVERLSADHAVVHNRYPISDTTNAECKSCGLEWPCPTRHLLDAVAEGGRELSEAEDHVSAMQELLKCACAYDGADDTCLVHSRFAMEKWGESNKKLFAENAELRARAEEAERERESLRADLMQLACSVLADADTDAVKQAMAARSKKATPDDPKEPSHGE